MKERTAADLIVCELEHAGVQYAFGLPGTQINPLLESFRKGSLIKFLNVRDEGAGAMMACTYSELSGELSVCLGIVPGAIKMLNGLYVAKVNKVPLISIAGTVPRRYLFTDYTQEVDLLSIYKDVAVFNAMITDPESCDKITRMAIAAARNRRGVSHLVLPEDVLETEINNVRDNSDDRKEEDNRDRGLQMSSQISRDEASPATSDKAINKLIKLLRDHEKTVILVGKGGRTAREFIIKLAERLSVPIFSTFPGRSSIGVSAQNYFGVLWIFSPRTYQLMRECELLIMVGTDYPYIGDLVHESMKVVQIDLDPATIGKRCRVEVGIVGDAKTVFEKLSKEVTFVRQHSEFLDFVRELYNPYFEELDRIKKLDSKPINVYRLINKLCSKVEDDAIITTGAGTHEIFLAQAFDVKDQLLITNHRYAPVGSGLPKAIGAKLACPDRQVINFEGDLSFQVCMAELITARQYDVDVKCIVVNNGKQLAIKLEQAMRGYEEFSTEIGNFDFVKFAEACGVKGLRADDPMELDYALDELLSTKGPALLDVIVDPNQLPLF